MNSRVSWSVDGIDPSVRERAEAAARRAGMSLSEWLNSTVGEPVGSPSHDSRDQGPAMPSRESRDVADIHQRLDSITRQIEQISKPAPRSEAPRGEAMPAEPTVARQLNDAISRLDARLSQITSAGAARQAPPPVPAPNREVQTAMVDRAAAQVYRPSPPLSPISFDAAIAEIAARQNELDGSPQQLPPRHAPPMAPAAGRRSGFLLARTSSAQHHEPARIAAPLRSHRGVDRGVPQRTRRNPPGHHRSDAAPGDRFDRERNPLAVPPHRRQPPERHRRPDAAGHRARARRNPWRAEQADAGRTAHRLRRRDPQPRRQARPDPALQRRPVDRSPARRRDLGAALDRLQCRLQRRAGAAFRRRAFAVGQGRPDRPRRRQRRFLCHSRSSALPR